MLHVTSKHAPPYCVHIDTSTSPAPYRFSDTSSGTVRVCIYYNGGRSHTYEYGLPVNFTRMSSFCAGGFLVRPKAIACGAD